MSLIGGMSEIKTDVLVHSGGHKNITDKRKNGNVFPQYDRAIWLSNFVNCGNEELWPDLLYFCRAICFVILKFKRFYGVLRLKGCFNSYKKCR